MNKSVNLHVLQPNNYEYFLGSFNACAYPVGGGGGGEWEGVWNPHPENSNLLNSHSKYTENRPRIPKQKQLLGPPGK